MIIEIKKVNEDPGFCKEIYKCANGFLYAKIITPRTGKVEWYSSTKDWVPDRPIRPDVVFLVVKQLRGAK